MKYKAFLKQVFLFSNFNDAEINLLIDISEKLNLEKNTTLFSDGDKAQNFYIVIDGCVKVFKLSPDGNEQTLHILFGGDLLAEAAIFDQQKYPATCKAIKPSSLLKISRQDFLNIILSNPELSLKMMSAYSKKLRGFVKTIETLSMNDVKQRLAKYILSNSKNNIFYLDISKKELASLLGTIPETISRSLNYLKKQGYLLEKSKEIQILDLEAIKSFISLT
jgi:CRP-like cAMP-binding protein